MRLLEVITEGENILKKKSIPNFFLDSEILMGKVLDKRREFIILNQNLEINNIDYLKYISLIQKRGFHKPIAYLTKSKNFWKNEFYVDERVLIPRPDSEIIIEEVLKIINVKKINNILEFGVGSGCIILSILDEVNYLKGVGIEISQKALEICKINSKRLNLFNRLKLYKSDIDKFNFGKYDIIISNPPYISNYEIHQLSKDVGYFEPSIALNGGTDGFSVIKKVILKTSKLLKRNGKFILEIGHKQKKGTIKLLTSNGFYINKTLKDLGNRNRCIVSTKI